VTAKCNGPVGGEEIHIGLMGSRPAWAALAKTEEGERVVSVQLDGWVSYGVVRIGGLTFIIGHRGVDPDKGLSVGLLREYKQVVLTEVEHFVH